MAALHQMPSPSTWLDLVSVAIALACFVAIALMIEGLDRV